MRNPEEHLITEFSASDLRRYRDAMHELWLKETTRPFAALAPEKTGYREKQLKPM